MTAGANSHEERKGGARQGDPDRRSALIEATELALATPPVGLVLIELLIETDQPEPASDPELLEKVIDQQIAELSGDDDRLLATDRNCLAVVKSSMTAPAEAEGFAYRLQSLLATPLIVGEARTSYQAAIGVAVSRAGDTAIDLVRYVEHALGDARMLGGDMVVVFDDQDRDLLPES